MKIPVFSILIFCFLIGLSACNSYNKVLKSTDYDFKLQKAKEYYNNAQYSKAAPLFEELIGVYKGTKSLEKIYYFYSYCLYAQRNYLLAEFYFKNFNEFYPKSIYAEDALYMVAYSNYELSPKDNLDQAYTNKAVEMFQVFINTYPESELVREANASIDELRNKMEVKAYSNAKLYFDLQQYKAAALSFENLLKDFPDTKLRDEALVFILKSKLEYAKKSVVTKQTERFQNTIDLYNDYINKIKNTKQLREAEKLLVSAEAYLEKIK